MKKKATKRKKKPKNIGFSEAGFIFWRSEANHFQAKCVRQAQMIGELMSACEDVVTANGWIGSLQSAMVTQRHIYERMVVMKNAMEKLNDEIDSI